MAKAEAASPMPPHARIPSYMTAFQSSPVRIWWQENPTRLCNEETTRKMGASLCLYGRSPGGRLREVNNKIKFQTLSSKSGSGRLEEVLNIVIRLGSFWYFQKLATEQRWSQPKVPLYPVTCTFCDAPKCLQFKENRKNNSKSTKENKCHSQRNSFKNAKDFKSLERFSTARRKTKTKVMTLTNHKGRREYSGPIKTQSKHM